MGERRWCVQGLVEKPEGKARHRWENNIKIDLQEVGEEEWTGLI